MPNLPGSFSRGLSRHISRFLFNFFRLNGISFSDIFLHYLSLYWIGIGVLGIVEPTDDDLSHFNTLSPP